LTWEIKAKMTAVTSTEKNTWQNKTQNRNPN